MSKLFLILLGACGTLCAQNGQVAVTVTDDAGALVQGAIVTLAAAPRYSGPGSSPPVLSVRLSGKTTTNGTLMFSNVPQGAYTICADAPNSSLLNSCAWTVRARGYSVIAGRLLPVPIVMAHGALQTVQVIDPKGLLSAELVPNRFLSFGVNIADGQIAGHWIPMKATKSGPGQLQYSLLVPKERNLKLLARTDAFILSDAKGIAVDTTTPTSFIPLMLRSETILNGAAPNLQFTLVGPKVLPASPSLSPVKSN